MTDNRIKGFFFGLGALGFVATSLMLWERSDVAAVMSLLGAAVSFAMSLMFLFSKKLDESFLESSPGSRLPYAEEEHIYSKEAEMVRAAQLRYGIRTVDRFNLLEIAGEVVREAVAAERKLWMKKNKKRGSR